MIKIVGGGNISGTGDIKKKIKAGAASGNFGSILSSAIADETSGAGAAGATSPVAGVNPFLAIQQISDEETNRQTTIKYGNDLLDGLSSLREQLLIGEISANSLQNIKQRVANKDRSTFTDPNLKSIIEEIETRVEVEIAKLEVMTQ